MDCSRQAHRLVDHSAFSARSKLYSVRLDSIATSGSKNLSSTRYSNEWCCSFCTNCGCSPPGEWLVYISEDQENLSLSLQWESVSTCSQVQHADKRDASHESDYCERTFQWSISGRSSTREWAAASNSDSLSWLRLSALRGSAIWRSDICSEGGSAFVFSRASDWRKFRFAVAG